MVYVGQERDVVRNRTGKAARFNLQSHLLSGTNMCRLQPKDRLAESTRRSCGVCEWRHLLVRYVILSFFSLLSPVLTSSICGELVDPFLARYTRLNKSGTITSSSLTSIKWLPPSAATKLTTNHFVTSHNDGTVVFWDPDRDDWSGFVANEWAEGNASFVVTKPMLSVGDRKGSSAGLNAAGGVVGGGNNTKLNPISHWKLSKKAITGRIIPSSSIYPRCSLTNPPLP